MLIFTTKTFLLLFRVCDARRLASEILSKHAIEKIVILWAQNAFYYSVWIYRRIGLEEIRFRLD